MKFEVCGQVDLAETDENGNENERGNENEKGNGRQDSYKCGIGRRPCKLMRDSVVHPETKYHRQAALSSYIISWANIRKKICQSGVWQDLSGLCI